MKWNIYILGGSIIFVGILYAFYLHGKGLPSVRNKIFECILIVLLLNGSLNFILTYLDGRIVCNDKYFNLLYIFDSINFILYQLVFFLLFVYGVKNKGLWREFKKYKVLYAIPIIISSLIIISSPWTNWVYSLTCSNLGMGFSRGRFFNIIPAIPLLYGFIYFCLKNKNKNNRGNKSTSIALAVAFIGILVNHYFKSILLTEFFLSISIMIIYTAMENPEYYHWESTKIYNIKGFFSLIEEYFLEKKIFYCCGINITNYNSLKVLHGSLNVYYAMRELAKWIDNNVKEGYVFYTNNQCFVIVSEKEIDLEKVLKMTEERFNELFKTDDTEVFFRRKIFSFKDPYIFKGEKELLTGLNIAMEDNSNDKEVSYIDLETYFKMKRKIEISRIVRKKIKEKDVEIYLQPIYCTRSKKITGAEALVRIFDDYLGLIPPSEFISLTEANGEIVELGLIIFEKTCEYMRDHNLEEMGLEFINVNLSPVQLLDVNLVDDLLRIVDEYGVDIKKIHFEITETNIIENEFMGIQINKLSRTGACVALDDFGKGTSNLERLLKYPFAVAKLDMLLVWSYFKGTNKILKNVIAIFKDERLKIVAEGVEKGYMVDVLSELGCDYLQGYYFSKPLPQEEFNKYVKDFNGN